MRDMDEEFVELCLRDGCDAIANNLKAGAMFQDGRVGMGMQLEKA